MIIELESMEDARRLVRRTILTKDISLLLTEAECIEVLLENVRNLPEDVLSPYDDVSFKFHVEGYNRSISMKDQVEIIERFSFMKCRGY